jgi:Subtilase family/Secretion system C-terminal sorting domain
MSMPFAKSNIPNDRFIGGSDPKQSSLVPIGTNTDAHINADAAWDISVGIPSINVGIYDEPIYWKHIDFGGSSFQSSVIKGGKDFYNQLPIDGAYNRLPADNHGTAVAGIIGAMRNNSTGIAGIAGGDMNPNIPFAQRKPGVSLYSLGIFSGNRLAGIGTAANAIRYGVDSLQLHIQNHSWNSTYDSLEVLKYATLYAYKKGCVMVASRGNNGSDEVAYPACFRDNWVLNVGASGTDGKFKTVNNGRDRTLQSQFGNNVDILAPGSIDNVYTLATPPTTGQNNYTEFNATSAAAAHVSGSAALLLSLHNTTPPNVLNYPNNLSPDDVEFLLQKYSKPITGTGVVYDCDPSGNPILTAPRTVSFNARPNEYNGWGLLDIGNTLRMIKAPKYHVLHPNQLATTNQTFQTIRNNTIRLLTSIGTLAAGVYDSVEIRQVGETYQHDYRNTRWKVINAWQRVGSSQGYEFQDSLYDEPYIDAFQANITPDGKQVSIQAEAFFYKIGTTWIPCDPNTPRKFRYSLHLEDATVGTKEVNTQMSSVNIYPNPTTGTLSIAYQLVNTPTLMKVEVFDITGRLIYTQEMPPLQNSVFSFEVNDFTTGAYMLCLTVDGTKSYHKIIKF